MSRGPVHPIDALAVAAVGAAPAASTMAQSGATHKVAEAVRFVDQPLIEFAWNGASAYLTATDSLAIVSALVLLIRFIAWALAPLIRPKD